MRGPGPERRRCWWKTSRPRDATAEELLARLDDTEDNSRDKAIAPYRKPLASDKTYYVAVRGLSPCDYEDGKGDADDA
jgi:hypothetical protein